MPDPQQPSAQTASPPMLPSTPAAGRSGHSGAPIKLGLMLGLGAVALAISACSGAGSSDGAQTRQVLIDYVHDEVASSFLMYFPRNVTMHPGDTIEFRQEWTGEPHSVTMGTLVDDMMTTIGPLLEQYADVPDDEIPEEAWEQFDAVLESLPWMLDQSDLAEPVNQNAAQPCFLSEGGPPEDRHTPCDDADQEQPPFDGTHSYYNSGFIPYQGPQGNKFVVELAEDIEPGVYNYYCNLHGPLQSGTITVVEEDEEIPSAAEVARQTRDEIDAAAKPIIEGYEQAKVGPATDWSGRSVEPPLVGAAPADPEVHAFVSEFIPETIQAQVGEPVSWSFVGGHTVSFQVPTYFSQITLEEDGAVVFNPDALLPVNGPGYPFPEGPPPEAEGEEPDGAEASPPEPPPPVEVDAGEWDGETFISSGLFFDGSYSLTFTEPGTYPYACLIHPQMVGVVVVE
ncbi:MAG TPA: hypothetical protein VML96_10660 [Egibacteraceae bacterium]|nr:hypothetical protein [Egibacteraceae bacterium]